jgi:hypothetical protein
MHTKSKIVGAAAVVAALAAGGSAFTDSNTGVTTSVAGYGTVTATGADVAAVHYTVDGSDSSKLSGVTVDLTGDMTASTVTVKWNDGSQATCAAGTKDQPVAGETQFVCTDEEPITGATSLAITVTNT